MAKASGRSSKPTARTPEARENEVIAMAYDLAEKQIKEGTASAMVITHFLKLGSQKARLEQETMKQQLRLMGAKTEAIESSKTEGSKYEEAIEAMRRYSGNL